MVPPRVDLAALGAAADPYPAYSRLRAQGALLRSGPGQWLVTRHAEVQALLRDERLGQFQFPDAYRLFPSRDREHTLQDGPAAVFTQRIVAGLNRPEHAAVRRLLAGAFTPRLVAGMQAWLAEDVAGLLGPALERGRLEAVRDLAVPLPLRVLCRLLGVPADACADVGARVLRLTKVFAPTISPDDRDRADEAVTWLRAQVRGWFRIKAGHPDDDVLSALAAASGAGMFAVEDAVDNAIFLLFAGLETSMNLLATGCAALAEHPAAWRALRAAPGLAGCAVEEVLRFDAPTQATGRVVRLPLEVAGHRLRPGRIVLLLLGSANRDERRFFDPDVLQLERTPNPHVSFGGGIHYCLGAALARSEATEVFGWLAGHARVLQAGGDIRRDVSLTLRSHTHVPLLLTG